jgi:hypothetical protein
MLIVLSATVAVKAQQISVVDGNGTTTLYHTLQDAIEGAPAESVIYLPGGGFTLDRYYKITKKLTIIGIGYHAKNGNPDGMTTINGDIFFSQNSNGSAVMGCYINGRVYIGGDDGEAVDNVMVKYCYLQGVSVRNGISTGTIINQNYISSTTDFAGASAEIISHNVMGSLRQLNGGTVSYNIIHQTQSYEYNLYWCFDLNVFNNVFVDGCNTGNNWVMSDNMSIVDVGERPINIGNVDWNDVFIDRSKGISPASNFHFKGEYKKYEDVVGIYAGTKFNDKGIAPVPYIVAKQIDEQTDASGKLNIKIRVNAGEE